MNPFPIEEDPVSVPPVSAYQRAIAAFESIARADRPQSWLTVRSREDVLVDAKAVDERVRAGERLPLAGTLVAIQEHPVAAQRLVQSGAVILGIADAAGLAASPVLDVVDAATCWSLPAECRGVVAVRPTRGLVPGPGEVTVLARNIDIGQHAAAALTGRDDTDPASRAWPASVRFSAGEHPRIAVPRQRERAGLPQPAQAGFSATVDTLRATGAVVEEISLTAGVRRWRGQPATTLDGFDALVLPLEGTTPALADLVGTLDVAAVAFSDRDAADAAVVTRAFDDQIAIDVVGQLSGIQADTPYPDTGVELAVFGAYLRGQPLNDRLAEVGARFTGFVETAPYYRMVALPGSPPQPGILRAAEGGGPLLAERWVVSEAGLGHFLAGLPAPMTLGSIDLAGGATATGLLCDPVAAAEGTDITAYGCWRAYLRYLSTRRADVPGPRPASG